MLGSVAAFEFRYQIKSPLALAVAGLLLIGSFVDMSVAKLMTSGGGNVLYNAPHSIIMSHVVVSLLFLFLGAAFVSNVILRDDQTGFGPIIRSTRIGKADYLFGRFIGAFGAGALILAAVPIGAWLGSLMPFADQEMLGPNRLSGFAYGYGLIALPNALIISAFLFALTTTTRSTAGTFLGVIGFLFLYLFSQRLMENQTGLISLRILADPLGASAYLGSSRYVTASEFNAGLVPITSLMVWSRLLWTGLALGALAITYMRFAFAEPGISRRQRRKLRREASLHEAASPPSAAAQLLPLPDPRPGTRAALAQFAARARFEARFILRSPAFLILLLMAFVATLPSLLNPTGWMGLPLYPLSSVLVPAIQEIFSTVLIVVATYYGGELVWRERERNIHEIVDAAPLPAWTLMLPKIAGLAAVLFATLAVGMGVGLLAQLLDGGVEIELGKYLVWYLLPGAVDALLVAVLSVFVQALSPGKYAGWGVMAAYIVIKIFGPSMGLEYPLTLFGSVPADSLFDLSGTGNQAVASWWFRFFWAAVAALMLVAAHLLWPRGTDRRLRRRLSEVPGRLTRWSGLTVAAAAVAVLTSGGWIVYNTRFLNAFTSAEQGQAAKAEYEKRYFQYASLPQPTVRHVELDVALYPQDVRAEVRGRYRLVNETGVPIRQLHLRLLSPGLQFVDVAFPGARLRRDDKEFDYRIYMLDRPMQPGEERWLAFRTRRSQSGFRAVGTEERILPNGTNLSSLELLPRIGMSDVGLIEDPALRREHGLPERQPLPRLGDLAATLATPAGDLSWTTSDITLSTVGDQVPVAPGHQVWERVRDGRRIARFVSATPISNFLLFQSARYAVKKQRAGGVEYTVYYHPAHIWNVERMLTAMRAAVAYYSKAFGPYQFDQARIVERPLEGGGQSFPNTIAVGEAIFAMDFRNPATLDMVSMLTAHEIAHQWWGNQVRAARMQGGSMIGETLAQYSALMVLRRLKGEENIRRFTQFQVDRYLSGRRTAVLDEQPLVSAGIGDDHINYGKGAIAFYLLQKRMGEAAVNRALSRFVQRYRFTTAPYPRSVDLVGMLREEATTPELQQLITDLFERITLYGLRVDEPRAVKRADGRWDVTMTVDARKIYADAKGRERPAPLSEPIEIGLFAEHPSAISFDRRNVIVIELRPIRSGRQTVRFVTDRPPTYASVDPYQLYIDRNSSDNVASVMK
jgi:hypothetical protein